MQRLIDGVRRFRSEEFGRYQRLFQRLAVEGQSPHTLFITCADSRVIAELITDSQPGDIFVVKNVGNIVPASTVLGSTNSTAAAIEFAVEMLKVSDIVVCGHSQCGAMKALLEGLPNSERVPHLEQWLTVAEPVRQVIQTHYTSLTDPTARITAAAQENVLTGLENLHTYPAVRDRLADGSLRLHGWFFKIATADLYAYDPDQRQFVQLLAGLNQRHALSVRMRPLPE